MILTNSTVSGNQATGVSNSFNCGGGFLSLSSDVTVHYSTFSGNQVAGGLHKGGGICIIGGEFNLANTLIANSVGDNCSGSPNDLGNNLVDDATCGISDNLTGLNPILADNGGFTFTHALLESSPAIDAIPIKSCIVAEDQRGVIRPQGSGCDIGAFEYVTPIPPVEWIEITLQSFVDNQVLTQHQADVLINHIYRAEDMVARGSTNAACNKLDAFINQVQAYVNSGRLTVEEGQSLIDYALSYQEDLLCST